MTPDKLRAGDSVYGGTMLKGVVLSVRGMDIDIIWQSVHGTDTLRVTSPLWVFLRLEKQK